ncbi:hypothetical protein HELRODRAFT_183649 [Helobdella robusta]|uniref:Uncharacterized protein n=1 Tax=Helobdella robusta TaxID=6412 RepID=T1FJZ7_HELRO|nr:hypothetical protein HELRODRAFT_183649 [Helobdella robusta]ESO10427.1 hypothetical protein HELRODRAFT_183649 [Helobdella robusta]
MDRRLSRESFLVSNNNYNNNNDINNDDDNTVDTKTFAPNIRFPISYRIHHGSVHQPVPQYEVTEIKKLLNTGDYYERDDLISTEKYINPKIYPIESKEFSAAIKMKSKRFNNNLDGNDLITFHRNRLIDAKSEDNFDKTQTSRQKILQNNCDDERISVPDYKNLVGYICHTPTGQPPPLNLPTGEPEKSKQKIIYSDLTASNSSSNSTKMIVMLTDDEDDGENDEDDDGDDEDDDENDDLYKISFNVKHFLRKHNNSPVGTYDEEILSIQNHIGTEKYVCQTPKKQPTSPNHSTTSSSKPEIIHKTLSQLLNDSDKEINDNIDRGTNGGASLRKINAPCHEGSTPARPRPPHHNDNVEKFYNKSASNNPVQPTFSRSLVAIPSLLTNLQTNATEISATIFQHADVLKHQKVRNPEIPPRRIKKPGVCYSQLKYNPPKHPTKFGVGYFQQQNSPPEPRLMYEQHAPLSRPCSSSPDYVNLKDLYELKTYPKAPRFRISPYFLTFSKNDSKNGENIKLNCNNEMMGSPLTYPAESVNDCYTKMPMPIEVPILPDLQSGNFYLNPVMSVVKQENVKCNEAPKKECSNQLISPPSVPPRTFSKNGGKFFGKIIFHFQTTTKEQQQQQGYKLG